MASLQVVKGAPGKKQGAMNPITSFFKPRFQQVSPRKPAKKRVLEEGVGGSAAMPINVDHVTGPQPTRQRSLAAELQQTLTLPAEEEGPETHLAAGGPQTVTTEPPEQPEIAAAGLASQQTGTPDQSSHREAVGAARAAPHADEAAGTGQSDGPRDMPASAAGPAARVPIPIAHESRVPKPPVVRGVLKWKPLWMPDWKHKFLWLVNQVDDAGRGLLFCSVCRDQHKPNMFASQDSVAYKTSSLNDHAKSRDHLLAIWASSAKQKMQKTIETARSVEFDTAVNIFRAAYWIAKEKQAFLKFDSLLTLLELSGVDRISKEMNHSDKECARLCEWISQALFEAERKALLVSPVVSLGIDESTDVGSMEHMIVYAKYIDSNNEVSQRDLSRLLSANHLVNQNVRFTVWVRSILMEKLRAFCRCCPFDLFISRENDSASVVR